MTHTTTPATATCAVCRAQWSSVTCKACEQRICRGCCDDDKKGGQICRACAYGVMGTDMVQRARSVQATVAQPKLMRRGRARRVLAVLAIVASLATAVCVLLPKLQEAREAQRVFAYGPVGDGGEGLDACVAGLWDVRAALDRYVHDHAGVLPRAFDVLEGAPRTCPGCGGAWSAQFAADGTWRVGCPTPGRHERVEVFLDQCVGPPQIRMVEVARGEKR